MEVPLELGRIAVPGAGALDTVRVTIGLRPAGASGRHEGGSVIGLLVRPLTPSGASPGSPGRRGPVGHR